MSNLHRNRLNTHSLRFRTGNVFVLSLVVVMTVFAIAGCFSSGKDGGDATAIVNGQTSEATPDSTKPVAPTATSLIEQTAGPTVTAVASPTASPVAVGVPTPVSTATSTPNTGGNPTPIVVPTATETPSAVPVVTITIVPTEIILTPGPTLIPTATASATSTPIVAQSVTPTPSPTSTPRPSPTPDVVQSPTPVVTSVPTPTQIPSGTGVKDTRFGLITSSPGTASQLNTMGVDWYIDYSNTPGNISGKNKVIYQRIWSGDTRLTETNIANIAASAPGSVWYLGGEPNVIHGGFVISPVEYMQEFDYYSNAIRTSDPSAKIMGPSILNWSFTCTGCSGFQSGQDWMTEFIDLYRASP